MSPRAERAATAAETAALFYRPEYERLRWGRRTLHLFWFRDRNGRRTHQIVLRLDPRAPAREVRSDLARLSRAEFEAKYAAYRLGAPPEPGDLFS